MRRFTLFITAIACAIFTASAHARVSPLSTAFTYQGQLNLSGSPVNGTADFQFTLWDALSGPTQIGGIFSISGVAVSNGQFTVQMDFGASAFNGDARWLQVAARSPAGVGSFTTLTPRQPITAVPYALQTRGLFVDSAGNLGVGTAAPGKKLSIAGDMEVGTNSGDYRHLRFGGGNSDGFIYGSYPHFGDGIHMGYNYYANSAGTNQVVHPDGGTSRLSTGYGTIVLATGAPFAGEPKNRLIVDQEGTISFNNITSTGPAGSLYTDPPTGASTFPILGQARTAGALALYGPAGNTRFGVRSRRTVNSQFPNEAEMFMDDAAGTNRISITINGEGGAQGSNGTIICTNLTATGAKNFLVPNPDNPQEDITYAALEGPECGMYMRGTARLAAGRAHIDLPATFSSLASKNGLTVILTPLSAESNGLACVNRTINGFDVVELMRGEGTYEFDWEIKAVRRGMRDYKVVHPWTDNATGDGSADEIWSRRIADIQKRNDRFNAEDDVLGPRP